MKFEGDGIITLSNSLAECKISLWGGNILSYLPKSQKEDVFWMGEKNKFDNKGAIRGGIPVCWPRFSEEKLNECFPRHGVARLSNWSLKSVTVNEANMEVELTLSPDEKYNLGVRARLLVRVSDKLECCLETINNSDGVFEFSEALHSYFNVGDRDKVKIRGLKGYQYVSALDDKIYDLEDDLQIKGEFDGAFFNHQGNVEIVDEILGRIIRVEKHGSNSTVVWNPDKDLAEMSEGQYKRFVCVEPANQGQSFVRLAPRKTHKLTMVVNIQDI